MRLFHFSVLSSAAAFVAFSLLGAADAESPRLSFEDQRGHKLLIEPIEDSGNYQLSYSADLKAWSPVDPDELKRTEDAIQIDVSDYPKPLFYRASYLASVNGSISVVVKAEKSPSRDAHFNWEFTSANGASPRIGQYACGSYWVAPAAGDSGVTFLSLQGNPEWNDLLSCDADPETESHGLLDGSNDYGSHNPEENLLPKLPLTLTPEPGSCISLVAAMQRNEAETSNGGTKQIVGEVVDAYNVVTVLPEPPPNGGANSIRPNITGATKEFLTWDDFDLTRLPTYDFLEDRDSNSWDRVRERWSGSTEIFGMRGSLEPDEWRVFSEGGRAYRSHILISNYAAGVAQTFNSDVLALLAQETPLAEKKPALAAMLSYGLDIYHARYQSGNGAKRSWSSGAGQFGGQYLPAVLLAALQTDETKAHLLRKTALYSHADNGENYGPQELRQVTRGVTGVLLWGDFNPFIREGNELGEGDWWYWSDFKGSNCYDTAVGECKPYVGKKTVADPYGYTDGPANKPGESYMSVSFGGVRGLAAIMILVPRVRSVVNTDNPIEYADRVTRHGLWTYPDPVAPPSVEDQTNGCSTYWAAEGCSDWGVTWGPNLEDVRFAIEDGTGRFVSYHGQEVSTGYESSQAKKYWPQILELYQGYTYEDYAVELGVTVAPEILFETGEAPRAHLHCSTPDAQIHYTLDGTEPDANSPLYTGPLPLSPGETVTAIALHPEKQNSATRSRTFDTF